MNKKLFSLVVWYALWSFVNSKFNKKNSKELNEDLKTCNSDPKAECRVILDNFMETQKEFFSFLKENISSEESKTFIWEKKEQLKTLIDDYKVKWEKLLSDLNIKIWWISSNLKEKSCCGEWGGCTENQEWENASWEGKCCVKSKLCCFFERLKLKMK